MFKIQNEKFQEDGNQDGVYLLDEGESNVGVDGGAEVGAVVYAGVFQDVNLDGGAGVVVDAKAEVYVGVDVDVDAPVEVLVGEDAGVDAEADAAVDVDVEVDVVVVTDASAEKYANVKVDVHASVDVDVGLGVSVESGVEVSVMYPEFVVCNIAGNCITNAENSTIFYFKSVSTWQEEPTAHVRSA